MLNLARKYTHTHTHTLLDTNSKFSYTKFLKFHVKLLHSSRRGSKLELQLLQLNYASRTHWARSLCNKSASECGARLKSAPRLSKCDREDDDEINCVFVLWKIDWLPQDILYFFFILPDLKNLHEHELWWYRENLRRKFTENFFVYEHLWTLFYYYEQRWERFSLLKFINDIAGQPDKSKLG